MAGGKVPNATPVRKTSTDEMVATIGDGIPQSSNDFLSAFGAEDEDEEHSVTNRTAGSFDIAGDEVDNPDVPLSPESLKAEELLTTKVEELPTPEASPAKGEAGFPGVGHVMRWMSGDGEESLIEVPKQVTEENNAAEAALEAADLAEGQAEVDAELKGETMPTSYKDVTVSARDLNSESNMPHTIRRPVLNI